MSASNKAKKRRVMLYPSRRLIEVAPGQKIAPLPADEIPGIAIARMQPVGDGTYRPILITHEPAIGIMEAAKLLKVHNLILRRLARGGFISVTEITPGKHQLDLASWFEHLRKVKADPDFWEKNRKRYRATI